VLTRRTRRMPVLRLILISNTRPVRNPSRIPRGASIQRNLGIATKVPIQFLSVGGNNFATSLLDTTTFLDGVASPPTVMTTSYGSTESSFGSAMATSVYHPRRASVSNRVRIRSKICNGYMALGSRGISVVFASGDVSLHWFSPLFHP
jgi:hypothetical protein